MNIGSFDFIASGIITSLFKAILNGPRRIKVWFFIGVILGLAAIGLGILADSKYINYAYRYLALALGVLCVLIIAGIYAYQIIQDETEVKEKIQKVEDRVLEHPNEPTAAWELARIKLESYLSRNLIQIRWIFFWTVTIMLIGFAILSYGIVRAYEPKTNINATLITTISGLLIEFIGATFLIIYKSTMAQAKDYVNVLERINAVGMSVQIVDRIQEDQKLKNQTGAELAKILLDLYGLKKQ